MPRKKIEDELKEILDTTVRLGYLTKRVIRYALQTVLHQINNIGETVKSTQKEIEELEDKTETLCVRVLATQQPVGKDLRAVETCLRLLSDFVYLGQLSRYIIEIASLAVPMDSSRNISKILTEMANLVDMMLSHALAPLEREESIHIELLQNHVGSLNQFYLNFKVEIEREWDISAGSLKRRFSREFRESFEKWSQKFQGNDPSQSEIIGIFENLINITLITRTSPLYMLVLKYFKNLGDYICIIAARVNYMKNGERIKIS